MYISNVRTVNFVIQTKRTRLVSDVNQAAVSNACTFLKNSGMW